MKKFLALNGNFSTYSDIITNLLDAAGTESLLEDVYFNDWIEYVMVGNGKRSSYSQTVWIIKGFCTQLQTSEKKTSLILRSIIARLIGLL